MVLFINVTCTDLKDHARYSVTYAWNRYPSTNDVVYTCSHYSVNRLIRTLLVSYQSFELFYS